MLRYVIQGKLIVRLTLISENAMAVGSNRIVRGIDDNTYYSEVVDPTYAIDIPVPFCSAR